MKKILLLSTIIVFCINANAKIWRVNNNPGLDGDVQQGQTLFDGNTTTNPEAAAGDSIYFEPSATVYNSVDINKANIKVFGYGYFLANHPGIQAMTNNARVSYIQFQNGSAGSVVSGLELTDGFYIYTGNVTMTRCLVNTIHFYNNNIATTYAGIRIDKCFIRSGINSNSIAATVTSVTVAIENCIFSAETATSTSGISVNNKVRGLLRNNVFNQASNNFYFNFYVANNIYVGPTSWGSTSESGNNVFRNNLFSHPITQSQYALVGGNTGANSGNVFSVDMALVFNGPTDNIYNGTSTFNNRIEFGTFNTETRFGLDGGANPALNAGEGGAIAGGGTLTTPNCGPYGATDPYRNGGFPNIPRITALSIPATVPNGAGTMTINVSSSSNN